MLHQAHLMVGAFFFAMRPGEFSGVKTRGQTVLMTLWDITILPPTWGPMDPLSVHPENRDVRPHPPCPTIAPNTKRGRRCASERSMQTGSRYAKIRRIHYYEFCTEDRGGRIMTRHNLIETRSSLA
jgi:hypothetical protein